MKKTTQYDRVLNHLQKKPITSLDAINLYGITRLGAIIFNLRREGYEIETKYVSKTNRYGELCYVAQYELMED